MEKINEDKLGNVYLSDSPYSFKVMDKLGEEMLHYHYEFEKDLSYFTFLGFVPDKTVIEIYKFVAKFMYANQIPPTKSYTDLRRIEGAFDGFHEWMVSNFLPSSVAVGLRYAATVRGVEFYARLATEEQERLFVNLGYDHRYFDTPEEALAWLEAQE